MFRKIRFWLANYFTLRAVSCLNHARFQATNYPAGSLGFELYKLWMVLADVNFGIVNGLIPEFRKKEKVEA